MKYRLTNRQAQIIYWSAEDDQFQVKEGSPIHGEFLKLLADDPYKNPKFRPTIDVDILGYWLGKELAGLAEYMATDEEITDRQLSFYFDFAAKFAGIVHQTEQQFKTLFLLTNELNVLFDKMEELAAMMDKNHPESLQAIKYYTTHVIEVLSVKS